MSFFRRSEPRPATEKIENVLGPSSEFRGDLKTEGGVRIDGGFEGTVESQSNVIVGENARVLADLSGFNITVAGIVEGNVKAVGRLEILSTGQVTGDVQVGSLLIEEGGVFRGQSLMDTEEETAPEGGEGTSEPAARDRQAGQAQQTEVEVQEPLAETSTEDTGK